MPTSSSRADAQHTPFAFALAFLSCLALIAGGEHRCTPRAPAEWSAGWWRPRRARRSPAPRSRWSEAPIRAVSALDGRYTLSGRARRAGVHPGPDDRIRAQDGHRGRGAGRRHGRARTSRCVAEAVQLAEIAVSAEAERGTVNRALEEQRNANNIVSAVTAEQISKSPDSDAGQAVQRVSGVSVQDGKYVFVRGLGERYTTTSLNGVPDSEPRAGAEGRAARPVPRLAAGGDHHLQDLHPRPAGRLQRRVGRSQDPGVSRRARDLLLRLRRLQHGRDRRGPRSGRRRWEPSGGDRPAPSGRFPAAGGRRHVAHRASRQPRDQRHDRLVPQRLVATAVERARPTAASGSRIGGEDPVFSQPIGYIGSFTYSYGQEVRDERDPLADPGDQQTTSSRSTRATAARRGTACSGAAFSI